MALGLHFKALCEGRRCYYTSPVKALASEKFFSLCEDLGAENVGMQTGDASINPKAPIICCTAEILSNLALRLGDRVDAPYVVMDEFHYYADPERGVAWQVPLITLPRTQFLLMSATLGDMRTIEEHLRRQTEREPVTVTSEHRPVPLYYEYRETPLHETVGDLIEQEPHAGLHRLLHAARRRRAGAGAHQRLARHQGGARGDPRAHRRLPLRHARTARPCAACSTTASASTTPACCPSTGCWSSSSRSAACSR